MRLSDWARRKGIHPDTAYRWYQKGLIPGARKVNRTIIVDEDPQQLDRIEKKLDDLLHESRKHFNSNGGGPQNGSH